MKRFLTEEDYATAYTAADTELEIWAQGYTYPRFGSVEERRRLAMKIVDSVARSDIPVDGDITDIPGVKVQRDRTISS